MIKPFLIPRRCNFQLDSSSRHGFTIIEVLISLAVFSICIIGLARAQQHNVELSHRAEKKERALVVAQDLYEEMVSVPFSGSSGSDGAPRPERLGSVIAYNGLVDSPVHDVIGQKVPWGKDLARRVSIRQFTPEDRANVLPPLTPPTGEYAECKIEVLDIASDEVLAELEFVRTL